MANTIIIAGETSTGKSTSYCQIDLNEIKIKGLDPKKTFLFNTVNKEIPVKGGNKLYSLPNVKEGNSNMYIGSNYSKIISILEKIDKSEKFEQVIIEDGQYLMSMDYFNRREEPGYDKWAKMGFSFIDLIRYIETMRSNLTVYILMHTEEYESEKGTFIKLKTIGKMLDSTFKIEGLFSIVLRAVKVMKARKLEYKFLVKPTSEFDITKTPLGMFLDEKGNSLSSIPNDLGLVKKALEEYY